MGIYRCGWVIGRGGGVWSGCVSWWLSWRLCLRSRMGLVIIEIPGTTITPSGKLVPNTKIKAIFVQREQIL